MQPSNNTRIYMTLFPSPFSPQDDSDDEVPELVETAAGADEEEVSKRSILRCPVERKISNGN